MFEYLNTTEKNFLKDEKEIIPKLSNLFLNAVKNIKENNMGIAFSGGLDSSLLALLAQKANKKFKLYTVGLPNAQDTEYAARLALKMNWPLKIKILSSEEAKTTMKNVINILSKSKAELNPTSIGIASVLYATLNLAKKDNTKSILTGLGAEELFAGFKRHVNYGKDYSSKFIQKALLNGLKDMEVRDLARDLPIANHFKIKLITPFLDKELVEYAMKIHPSLKVNQEQKKIIMRKASISLGLPEEFALRKKLACQYGSKFDNFFEKLAKEKNLNYKKELIEHMKNGK